MIYLNNAATTKTKPGQVLKAVRDFLKDLNVSPGRGTDSQSSAADNILSECRTSLSKLFNADLPEQIVFTLNCSDALNTAVKGILKPGDHVIISPFEHNSVVRQLRFLEKNGIEVSIAVGCSVEGVIEPEVIKKFIKKNTKLIAVLHGSNVTGAIQPIERIGRIAKENGILFLVDAAQTAGIYDIDVKKQNIDLLAFAGHKGLMGPQGTGGLYIAEGVQNFVPLRHGGTGSQSEQETQPEIMPDKFETGTPNTPGIAGLKAGADFILNKGTAKIRKHAEKLTKRLLAGLKGIDGIKIYGPEDITSHGPVVSFNIKEIEPAEAGKKLEKDFGIIVRTGLHCAPICHKAIGTFPKGTVRISMGYYNTAKDIDKAVDAVKEIAAKR